MLASLLLAASFAAQLPAHLEAAGLLPTPSDPAPVALGQEPEERGETEKEREKRLEREAREVCKSLSTALASKERNVRIGGLVDAARTEHPRVIKAIAKTLRDKDEQVVDVTIELLGGVQHPDSLDALIAYGKRARKELQKNPERLVALVRAVGWQGNGGAIPWLLDGALDDERYEVRRMRVYAVARLRTPEALRALTRKMRSTDPRRIRGRMRELRTALIWMTGVDLGDQAEAWYRWEREAGKKLQLPDSPPRMEKSREQEWYRAWGEDPPQERQRERGDRG